MVQVVLQQFARYPLVGTVKTRLARCLGEARACAVHEELVLQTAGTLLDAALGPVELWLDQCRDHRVLTDILSRGVRGPYAQRGADLGARMYNALCDGQARAQAVILVGSDCPGIDAAYLREAALALRRCDVVLGPAEDGGYVLVGVRQPRAALFDGIPWSTKEVLQATLAAAAGLALSVHCLPLRYDVDDERDYRRWRSGA